jgi:hypothetical protein
MAGMAIVMTILAWGFFGFLATVVFSLALNFYTKRRVKIGEPGRRRLIVVTTIAPFLGLLWLVAALLIHVEVSNHLAQQDCGFSPDPYVTLPNGYVVGSLNTYDGYFRAPGFETDVPVTGPGYVRSLIDLRFSDPYFVGTLFDFKSSKVRSFVFDTRTRSLQVSEPSSPGDRPCDSTDRACLDAWTDANTHAQSDPDSYWKVYARYRHHWPKYVLLALIIVGEGTIALWVWVTWRRTFTGVTAVPS